MPSGSLMASVRMTYPLDIVRETPNRVGLLLLLADGLFRAALDGLLSGRFQVRRHLRTDRHRVSIVGQAEHVRAEREAHTVAATTLVIYPDFHAGVNSRCSSVRPRRMYVGTYW